MPLYNQLKEYRSKLGINQTDLGKMAGVSRQTISLIESGRYNPTLNLCISICRVLGKTLDDLFWEEDNEES